MKSLLFILLLITTFNSNAQVTNTDTLIKVFANIKTFQASFVQSLYGNNKKLIQKSKGKVAIQKPGKFRWNYQQPFEQIILSNGQDLWVYDVEMEQATVKPVDSVLSSAPAVLLGSSLPINQTFNLKDKGESAGLIWIELSAKEKESDFNKIFVALKDNKIKIMELHDNFGQTIQIQFKQVSINQAIKPDMFEFIPPKGVDVIGR